VEKVSDPESSHAYRCSCFDQSAYAIPCKSIPSHSFIICVQWGLKEQAMRKCCRFVLHQEQSSLLYYASPYFHARALRTSPGPRRLEAKARSGPVHARLATVMRVRPSNAAASCCDVHLCKHWKRDCVDASMIRPGAKATPEEVCTTAHRRRVIHFGQMGLALHPTHRTGAGLIARSSASASLGMRSILKLHLPHRTRLVSRPRSSGLLSIPSVTASPSASKLTSKRSLREV
jgi:hypothetical protein